jgi:hypothetical protein
MYYKSNCKNNTLEICLTNHVMIFIDASLHEDVVLISVVLKSSV